MQFASTFLDEQIVASLIRQLSLTHFIALISLKDHLQREYYAQMCSLEHWRTYPRTPGIFTDAQIASWKKVTDAVHIEGGQIFLQIWHVGRLSHRVVQPSGVLPVAPSAIKADGEIFTAEGPKTLETPRTLSSVRLNPV